MDAYSNEVIFLIRNIEKNIEWLKIKLNISNYAVVWVSFIKGLTIGLLIYHFFIN